MHYKNNPSVKSENKNQLIELKWLVEPSQLKQMIFKYFKYSKKFYSIILSTQVVFKYKKSCQV